MPTTRLTPTPFATTQSVSLTLISTPTVAIPTSTFTATLGVLSATPSVSPSPISCQRPTDWVQHTIRADETLYYLASSTGSTVEELMKINCLSSDLIIVGDPIFLPSIPPLRPTFPPPPAVSTPCPSPFSCRQTGLPPLLLDSGAPGGAGFDPCRGTLEEAWLDVFNNMMQIGDRLYVYACEFPADVLLTAKVELPDKTFQDVAVLPVPPNPDGEKGDAMGVVEWPALPGQPTGEYILTVTAADPNKTEKPLAFHVDPPNREHILVVPEVGPPGALFEVYYIYFDVDPTAPLDVALYGEDQPVEKEQHHVTGRYELGITIDNTLPYPTGKGWTRQFIQSFPGDPLGGYAVVFNYRGLSYKQLFWLRQP